MKTVRELWTYRYLIWNLAQRDLRARYKKSVLGWLWSLINPAATLLTMSLVFGLFLGGVAPAMGNGHAGVFALYLWAGLSAWNFWSGNVNGSIGALQSTGGLLNKVYFPPVCPAIANLLTVLTQTAIEFGILLAVMIVFGNVGPQLVLFPLFVVLFGAFSIGVGLFVSIFNVYYRDVGYLVGIALNLLFYATPIIYVQQNIPYLQQHQGVNTLIELNPLTQFVQFSRDIFYLQHWPSPTRLAVLVALSLATFGAGLFVFNRKAANVAEEL